MDKHPLQTLIEEAGYKCQDYSGRAMFGRRCLAVVLNARQLGNLISDLMKTCLDEDPDGPDFLYAGQAADAVRGICWDNMGMDMVYYWPDVPYTADEEEEEDDDG